MYDPIIYLFFLRDYSDGENYCFNPFIDYSEAIDEKLSFSVSLNLFSACSSLRVVNLDLIKD